MHVKTVIFVLSFVVGIFISEKLQFSTEIAIFSFVVLLVQAILFFVFKKKEKSYIVPLITMLVCSGLFLGVARHQFAVEKEIFSCESKCIVYGEVVDTPVKKDNYQEVEITLYKENNNYANVLVKTSLYPEFKAGERITIDGEIKESDILLPTEVNKKSFDYNNYLKTRGIKGEMFFPKIDKEGEISNKFIYKLITVKDNFISRVNKYISADVSPLANGMLFGSNDFSKEMKDLFRVAGISHIVVLSGFNIAIVVSFLLLLFSLLPFTLRILFTGLFTFMFVIMVGAEASAVRAFVMALISLLALYSGREYVSKQALILSLFVMVIYDTSFILDNVSFHLSFLATAGIVYLSPLITKSLERFKHLRFMKEVLSTTLSATIATLPYIIYTFGFISIYSLITNLIIVPIVPVAMLFSTLVILFSFVSVFLTVIFGFVTTLLLKFIILIATFFASLPFSYIQSNLSSSFMFLIYVLVVVLYFILKNKLEEEKYVDEDGEEFVVIKY